MATYPQPMQPLSYGASIGSYGYNNPSTSMGAPASSYAAPAPTVPSPGGNANYLSPGYSAPTPMPAPMTTGSDSLSTALNTAMTSPAGGANQGNWLTDTFMNPEGGLNMGNLGSLVQGIGSLGSMWSAFQQNRQASEALDFQREAYNTNLANSISSYNLALEDRIGARYAQEGRSDSAADSYIRRHRLEA